MNEDVQLVKKESLDEVLYRMVSEGEQVEKELETILPYVTQSSLRGPLESRLRKVKEALAALRQGYIPVDHGWFVSVKTKDSWRRDEVRALLKEMPEEVKTAWKKAEELNVFKTIAISVGPGPDPILVGKAGGRSFYIGSWVTLAGGYAVGNTFVPGGARLPQLTQWEEIDGR